MSAPITIAETIVKTAAQFKKKPTSMSRRLNAAYVSATGAVSSSSIQVYNESGTLEESINGFNFSNASTVIPVRISINPNARTGWVNGPGVNQLQEFSY
ncbi:MAG: hypothetical protein WB681_00570 [Candidatus Cybelea sp.]